MPFFVKYIDSEGESRETRFVVRSSAEEEAEQISNREQIAVAVLNAKGKILNTYSPNSMDSALFQQQMQFVADKAETADDSNTIANILFFVGIAIMVAIMVMNGFVGVFVISAENGSGSSVMQAIIWWISGFVAGMLFIGFAEVIRLLQKTYNRTHRKG